MPSDGDVSCVVQSKLSGAIPSCVRFSPCFCHHDVVRGLCIATLQYSSFCVCAVVLVLGGFDHMEDDDQDRRDEGIGQDVKTHEKEEEVNGWKDNERPNM